MDSLKIAIVGATGAVGLEIVNVLHQKEYPVPTLYASRRSAGKILSTPYGSLTVEEFQYDEVRAHEYNVLFLAVSGSFSLLYGPKLALPYSDPTKGPWVIDNSSAFRLDPNVPLIVPEINASEMKDHHLIANPNCTTAIAAMVLWPIHCQYEIQKCIVSTYQAASGAGAEGMEELKNGCMHQLQTNEIPEAKVFAYPLPFNVIPHIDKFQENGYTKEEMKVTWETRKIFNEPNMKLSCTAVRIPTLRAHSESITIETLKPISPDHVRQLLLNASGVKLVDDVDKLQYPMPLNASGQYDVQVGRIRQNLIFGDHGLDLFVVGDQLLRGAALNAVLIMDSCVN